MTRCAGVMIWSIMKYLNVLNIDQLPYGPSSNQETGFRTWVVYVPSIELYVHEGRERKAKCTCITPVKGPKRSTLTSLRNPIHSYGTQDLYAL